MYTNSDRPLVLGLALRCCVLSLRFRQQTHLTVKTAIIKTSRPPTGSPISIPLLKPPPELSL